MLIQEYMIISGLNPFLVPLSSQFMAVHEHYGNMQIYFKAEEDDFAPMMSIEVEVVPACGNCPKEAEYVGTVGNNNDVYHVFIKEDNNVQTREI